MSVDYTPIRRAQAILAHCDRVGDATGIQPDKVQGLRDTMAEAIRDMVAKGWRPYVASEAPERMRTPSRSLLIEVK